MGQMQKVGTHATTIGRDSSTNMMTVKYQNTYVVSFNDVSIILNTGGWFTNTTKTRMNQASNQFGLGYQVYQKDFEWFVDYKGKTHQFDGNELILTR